MKNFRFQVSRTGILTLTAELSAAEVADFQDTQFETTADVFELLLLQAKLQIRAAAASAAEKEKSEC